MQMKQMGSLSRSAQAGFTLIELIVVIVILGILAATALPKFADMGADARLSKIKGARGAVVSATSVVHGRWLVAGSVATAGTYTLDGVNVTYNTAGYPTADDAGIVAAAGLSTTEYSISHNSTTGVSTILTDSSHSNCKFTYTASTGVVSDAPSESSSC